MKKLTILFTFFLTAVLIMSCSKESSLTGTVPPNPPPPPPPPPVKIASSWFSPVFTIANDRSSIYLMAYRDHENSATYDKATHVELAFAKLNYRRLTIIKRLPVMLSASQQNLNDLCEINFALDNTGCIVTIKNADRNALPVLHSNPFPDLQIRYVIIPRTLFESLNVNWDDYAAAALALNI